MRIAALFAWVIAAILAAGAAHAVNVDAVMTNKPPRLLSTYDLFKDARAQKPGEGVVPYDLITPLFSDYATKYRFIHVPEGEYANYDDNAAFEFPVGTVLIKTFAYPADMREPDKNIRLIETRLLIKKADGWVGLPYIWNTDMTEATLKRAGTRLDVSWVHTDGMERSVSYKVPNVNQCKGCHASGDHIIPIGPKARNLNHDYMYSSGSVNQLVHWRNIGLLHGLPENMDDIPRVPVWDNPYTGSVETRARAYIDINCAHCHVEDGPASSSGLYLDYNRVDPVALGLNKRPVAAGRGSGGRAFDIDPGKPDGSITVFRMESTDPGIMMPELGRGLVHEEGVALVREWIAGMTTNPKSD